MNKLRDLFDDSKVNEVYQSWIDLANKEHHCSVCGHFVRTFFCNGSEEYECELTGEKFPNKKECGDWVSKTVVFGTGEDNDVTK